MLALGLEVPRDLLADIVLTPERATKAVSILLRSSCKAEMISLRSMPRILTQRNNMKIFEHMKDGGPDSNVDGFFLVEIKSLFSIALLKFSNGTREAFHNHAFNSASWVIGGWLHEKMIDGGVRIHIPKLRPIITRRSDFHQVESIGDTWVFTLRGPWTKTWREYLPKENEFVTLTHGRKVVATGGGYTEFPL